ncbi:MAG: glutamine synthetase family protein [Methyloceanibacter sp.]
MSAQAETKAFLETHGIHTVIAIGTDPVGVARGKRLNVDFFLKAATSGIGFSSYIMATTTVDEVLPGLFDTGVPDVKGLPDLSTLRLAPWEPGVAVCLMDWIDEKGGPHPLCPRSELKRQKAALAKLGFDALFSLELEFYLLPIRMEEVRRGRWSDLPTVSRDVHCYSIYEGHFWEPVLADIRRAFPDAIEGSIPEWGPGQFEVNLYRADPVAMADTAVLFKTATKQIAARAGLSATFMAKIEDQLSGSSGHIHQSLVERASGKPAFYDSSQPLNLSPVLRHFLAGQLDVFLPATLCYAPFVNSYKRYQPDSFAGCTRTWGIDNRTVGLRVINNSAKSCRVENRLGGADLNPYVAFAASIGAGVRGMREKLPLSPTSEGNAYQKPGVEVVPSSLRAACETASASQALREIFDPGFIDNLIRIAAFEVSACESRVSDVERRRYLEMV